MSAPTAQVQEGPSHAPPTLPAGWIAQWDGQRYYFVNMATRVSQWEMPTHDASTTYQENQPGANQHNAPGSGYDATKMNNPNDNHGVYAPNGNEKAEATSNDRSLSGNLGQLAMNQLLGGGKKANKSSSSGGGLGALAGQLLGGSSHGGSSHGGKTSASAITGSLVSSLLGGKQPNKTGHSSTPSQQSNHGGLMDTVSGLFGKSEKPNQYGYSQNSGPPGGYSGSVPPPSSYQSNNSGYPQHNQNHQNHQNQHYYPQNQNQSQPHQNFPQQPNNSQSYSAPPSGQFPYNTSLQHNHQQNSIPHPHPQGHAPFQNMYDNGPAPPAYQQSSGEFHGSNHSNAPTHSSGYPQGQYPNTQGGHATQQSYNQHDNQWNNSGPPLPTGSHPGYQQTGSHGSQGGYGGH